MSDRVVPGPLRGGPSGCKEACCISTAQILDSCRDKDCFEDLRVFLNHHDQCLLEKVSAVKLRRAELLYVHICVEDVPFKDGFFTVDARFFYRVFLELCGCDKNSKEISGMCAASKRVLLYGGESKLHVFTSNDEGHCGGRQANLPLAVVEAVDPIPLGSKIVDCGLRGDESAMAFECEMPECLARHFEDDFVTDGEEKRLLVTLGQFSVIRLERESQLLIPCFDFCLPEKVCEGGNEHNPCELFNQIKFPIGEFCPSIHPKGCGCGCNHRSGGCDIHRGKGHDKDHGRRGCGDHR